MTEKSSTGKTTLTLDVLLTIARMAALEVEGSRLPVAVCLVLSSVLILIPFTFSDRSPFTFLDWSRSPFPTGAPFTFSDRSEVELCSTSCLGPSWPRPWPESVAPADPASGTPGEVLAVAGPALVQRIP